MGQYYEAVLRKENNDFLVLNPHAFDEGAKLLEHSYVKNPFVERVIQLLTNNPMQLAWVGDYSELGDVTAGHAVNFLTEFYKLQESNINYDYNNCKTIDEILAELPINDFDILDIKRTNYVIFNKTKKEYVDIEEYLSIIGTTDGYILNPLPILTSVGNGKGGGDYYEASPCYERVGSWACDTLVVITKSKLAEMKSNYASLAPFEYDKYKNIVHEVLFLDD